ncbi:FMN-dependent oxidoreductase, nitrilotriacetate monooxygenase family [Cellulosimicrobium cellulans]|nr:FMN-dependent oxidoreductase, nitrilotriacetate monooxygenase family [Cellulosimicrobium cellulans]
MTRHASSGHRPGHLHLNAFLMSTGHHEASWRLPESDPSWTSTNIAHLQRLAQVAEAGKLDSIFFADGPGLRSDVGRRPAGSLDPLIVLTAIATVTERIGLIATASTTYNSPYNLARRFASIDHVSGGRAGWNVVTTAGPEIARNFGLDDQPAHAVRYERAAEFLDVAFRLWDSWEDDAVLADKAAGVWADPAKIHGPAHVGTHFSVHGALTTPRSPQARPLVVQAGSSEDGRDLAARYAEAVFTAHQTLADAQAFYSDLKARAVAVGRDPGTVKILPGIVPEYARAQLAKTLRLAPEDLPLDRELPDGLPTEDEIEGAKSRYTLIVELARRERLTVRQLIGRLGGGRGHRTFAGTPEQVADAIQDWYDAEAADGFNIMPAVLPSGLEQFVEHVLPVLRERGLFRTEYEGRTLREHYGLERPANRYTDAAPAGTSSDGGARVVEGAFA